MSNYIEFKEKRELGDVFSDTFAFVRSEYKPLFKALLSIAGPYMLLMLFAIVFYIYIIGDSLAIDFTNPEARLDLFSGPKALIMLIAYLTYFITLALAYTYMTSTTLHYMKSYHKNKGSVNLEDVKKDVKQTFWSFLGLSLLKITTLMFAFILCCLPVFYFIVPMSVLLPMFVFTNSSVTDTYTDSYALVRDHFFPTLLTLILFGILIGVVNSSFAIPMTIYTYIKMGVFATEIDPANLNSLVDPIYIALNTITSFIQFITNIFIVIASVFIYFNLNERKNFTGTMERIESLGKTE